MAKLVSPSVVVKSLELGMKFPTATWSVFITAGVVCSPSNLGTGGGTVLTIIQELFASQWRSLRHPLASPSLVAGGDALNVPGRVLWDCLTATYGQLILCCGFQPIGRERIGHEAPSLS